MNRCVSRHLTGSAARQLGVAAILGAVIVATPANAQLVDVAAHPPDAVRFSLTPYLFLPIRTTGTATVADAAADVDLDGGDILDALNLAGAARGEMGYGRFSLIVDGYFANLGGGATVALPGDLGGTVRADIDFRQGWFAVMGAYRVHQGNLDDAGRDYAIDAGVGFRYNNLRQEITARVDLGVGPGVQTKLGGTEQWVEPVIMLRGGLLLSERWGIGARGEIGGFGANGSDLHWNVLVGADYRPWENTSVKLGWQFYGLDFSTERSDGTFAYDVFQTGPYIGATFRF